MQSTSMHTARKWAQMFSLHRATVSAAQKAALARVLAGRYRKLCAGAIYRTDRLSLPEPTEAIALDIALLLIGVRECLKDPDAAEKAVREIVVLFLRSTVLSDEARRILKPERLELRNELEMMKIWTQHSERSPMAAVLLYAAHPLFREQIQLDGGRETTTQLLRALLPDAFALYSKVLSIFGRAPDADRVTQSRNAANSTAAASVRAASHY